MAIEIGQNETGNIGNEGFFGNILVVEDDEGLSRLICKNLEREGFNTFCERTGAGAAAAIENRRDLLLLLDYRLPDLNAKELISKIREKAPPPPFVVMTGFGDQNIAVDMMKLGAVDYLVKDENFIDMLPATVRRAMKTLAAEKKAEETDKTLRETDAMYRYFLDKFHGIAVRKNADFTPVFLKGDCERITGYSDIDFIAGKMRFIDIVHPDDLDLFNKMHEDAICSNDYVECEYRIVCKDGQVRWLNSIMNRVYAAEDKCCHFQCVLYDITRRKRAEMELAESERKYRALFDNISDGILIADRKSLRFRIANKKVCEMLGYSIDELLAMGIEDIHPEDEMINVLRQFDAQVRCESPVGESIPCVRKDGSVFYADIGSAIFEMGGIMHVMGMFRDVTGRRRAEEEKAHLQEQLIQAQKMEAVGRLAGGVAHDFNNMLSVILGTAQMAMMNMAPTDEIYKEFQEILNAAERSADLTRQLLAFARKQTVAPVPVNLNDAVAGMIKMLQRLIGEDIDLVWSPGRNLWKVEMDPSQIDQILANLAVNARDAIAGVGKVSIETENMVCDEEYCADHAEFAPGEYVKLSISDNGCGMDRETSDHIFEPFYTTKETGKGTGLGLSTVFGIVRQNNGVISAYSEPGQGTTFKIYLPRFADKGEEVVGADEKQVLPGGDELVLIVEDEAAILNLGRRILEGLGYSALTAITPGEAISLFEERSAEISLLITDTVMPEMNGRELADRLTGIKPDLKCLFMSGYTSDIIAHHGVLDKGVHFVQKPFSIEDLARKVREALD